MQSRHESELNQMVRNADERRRLRTQQARICLQRRRAHRRRRRYLARRWRRWQENEQAPRVIE